MSQENVELLRRGYEHFERTGELLRESCHLDLVWDTTTFAAGGLLLGKCVGVDEANRWLARWIEGFEEWSLDVEELLDLGDQVIAFVRQRAKAPHGGPEVEMRLAQVWTFRSGLVERMEMYLDRAEALKAAGLLE
jgi:ketosteroid isomerase-like protein